MSMTGWIIIGVILLLLLFGVAIYNRLVRLRALVKEAFSGITVQLRRRADLIPNLVETVKGYASHEKATFEAVTAARALPTGGGVAATAAADATMTSLIGRLFAVAEAYPELRASENFQQLQSEISGIETELQSARRYYNATVRDLNTGIQTLSPTSSSPGPWAFREEEPYADPDASIQTGPKVSFERPAV